METNPKPSKPKATQHVDGSTTWSGTAKRPPLHYLISAEKRAYNGEVQSVVQKTANVSIRTGQRESAALSESV